MNQHNSPDRVSSPPKSSSDNLKTSEQHNHLATSPMITSQSSNVSSRPDPVNEYWLNVMSGGQNSTGNTYSAGIQLPSSKTVIPTGWRYLRHNDGYRKRDTHATKILKNIPRYLGVLKFVIY